MASLIVKENIDNIYNTICSRNFVKYIFDIDKSVIVKETDENIKFERVFTSKDLVELENLRLPSFIGDRFDGFCCTFETFHKILRYDSSSIVVKYTSVLRKPDYLYNLLGETKIILYVTFNVNKKDTSYTTVNINRKLLNSYSNIEDDDTLILDNTSNDILTNIYQQDKIVLQDNIVSLSESLFGKDIFHNVIMVFINTLYNAIFDIIQDTYVHKFIKFFSKKQIEVYKKKK